MTEHEFEWNDIYTGTANDYHEPDPTVLDIVSKLEPGRALDVGCGAGGLLAALASAGWKVTGVDIAAKGIEAARAVLESKGLSAELHVADAREWRPAEPFDLITCTFALPDDEAGQAALFATLRDVLAPGGTIVIKDFDASMKRFGEFARYHCPTVDELRDAFDGLGIVRAEVVETPAHHHGDDPPDRTWTAALLHARRPRDSKRVPSSPTTTEG